MLTVGLLVVAVLLTWPVPRLLPRLTLLEHVPGATLLLWQAVALSAIFAAVSLAPMAILQTVRHGREIPAPAANYPMLAIGLVISGLVIARLLLQGHRIGRDLRIARREHAELVDLLGVSPDPEGGDESITVLAHPTPTAYCIPGRRHRVVLTDSTIRSLPADELSAVLAHERAHLRLRHDLVLEFFTVLHTTVPPAIRSDLALREVRLLIEALADESACRAVGPVPVARALLQLAGANHPGATLGMAGAAQRRMELLGDTDAHRGLATAVATAAVLVLCVTGCLAWGALLGLA
ncbi:M56 family peptidase [Flexivirga caeni]|uniref:M56 family peptidase n=1 Tax=Flexivirga caeni TaxID=2294115 RepID=A0A3M9MIX4_9MICO|nr:M56 family peptidase [Flexivirga caeni]